MSRSRHPHEPILVIDDEEPILLAIDTTLQLAGFNHVITCRESRDAMALVQGRSPGCVLLDLNMPHLDGQALLPMILAGRPDLPVIVITGTIDVETAVQCMKAGALDYLVKPVDESRLIAAIHQALRFRELHRENRALRQQLDEEPLAHPEAFTEIVTASPKMIAMFRYIESIAPSPQPVLIRGETGVGKELVARAIHRLSGRAGPFVAVNVAGLDDNVFSDTLFGHVKGAFTGADAARPGLVEKAADGTLFLDEIGDLSQGSQVKLLRLLQEREYMPLGQDSLRISNARVIASTHADLWQLQQQGAFRKDLHYRLRTHLLRIPPLRDRKEDLAVLADFFAQRAAGSLDKQKPEIPAELMNLLATHPFPGNVRELQAMIFDAVAQQKAGRLPVDVVRDHMARAMRDGSAAPAAAPAALAGPSLYFPEPLPTLKEAARLLVGEAMRRAGHNQSAAAAMLGISQQALSKRLKGQGPCGE
jgi:DNA-binding NtrC family response regulator